MNVRVAARMIASALLWLACDCGGAADGLPSALAPYREGHEITATDEWTSPGLRFYRVTVVGADDLSSTSIVAVDASGALVEGADLFLRFTGLPPQELAEHACFTVIDGCTPLAAADPSAAMWLDGDASRVEAPSIEDGVLTFDTIEGDMHPQVVRIAIDLESGAITSHVALRDLTPPPPPPAAIPATIAVTMGAPGVAGRFVTATFAAPATITGCVSSAAGECAATVAGTLDADALGELGRALADLAAIPRCEPEALVPGDLDFALSFPGAPRPYTGHVPADESQMAGRNTGPCRADARLAWWIARWVLAQSRAASDRPSTLDVRVDVSTDAGPRFVNASIELASSPLAIVGCTSSVSGSCHESSRVELDATQGARLRVLLEDVRAEPCHVPFPAGTALSLEMGLAYDGRCGADPALAWWVARTLDPAAMDAR